MCAKSHLLRGQIALLVRPRARDDRHEDRDQTTDEVDTVLHAPSGSKVLVRIHTSRNLLLPRPLLKLEVLLALHGDGGGAQHGARDCAAGGVHDQAERRLREERQQEECDRIQRASRLKSRSNPVKDFSA